MFYETAKNDHGLARPPFKSCAVPRVIGWLSTVSAGAAVHGGGLLLSRTEDGTVTAVLSVAALPSDEHSVGSPVQLPDGSDAALEAFSTVLPPEAFRPEELL